MSSKTIESDRGSTGPSRRTLLAGGVALAAGLGFRRPVAAQAEGTITQTARFGIGEGQEEKAVAAIEALVAAVEEHEPGVLVYIAHRPADDPSTLFFYEVYANAAALVSHGQQPHMGEMRKAFAEGVFTGPLEIVRLDPIAGVRR